MQALKKGTKQVKTPQSPRTGTCQEQQVPSPGLQQTDQGTSPPGAVEARKGRSISTGMPSGRRPTAPPSGCDLSSSPYRRPIYHVYPVAICHSPPRRTEIHAESCIMSSSSSPDRSNWFHRNNPSR